MAAPSTTGFGSNRSPSPVAVPILAVVVLAAYDAAAGPQVVLLGLLTVGPCLAAIWGNRRDVLVVGGFVLATSLLLSWPDQLWWTVHQLLYLVALAGVTALCAVLADRRALEHERAAVAQARLAHTIEATTAGLALAHCTETDGAHTHDLDGALFTNSSLSAMFGWAEGPAPPELLFILAEASTDPVERTVRLPGGPALHLVVRRASLPLDAEHRATCMIEVDDVTAHRLAQAELDRVAADSDRSQRLESLGQMAGGIAHDFNNLLAVILNYTSLLADGIEDPAMGADLAEIRAAAERAASLTRQLLTFARSDVMRVEVIDLNDVVRGVASMLERTIGDRITFRFEVSPGLLVVLADRNQLEQVVLNLALNARDAMPEGGTLEITTGDHRSGGAPPRVELRVSDTGVGMTPEVRARAFEPFFTTKALGQGTGLGLATVHGIVTRSGGTISISSAPGSGTELCVLLPASSGVPEVASPLPLPVQPGGERILLVEDEVALRTSTVRVLRRAGYDVIEATDGLDALAVYDRECGLVDLVLTDLAMPVMRGDELARRLMDLRPSIKIVIMSGHDVADVAVTRRLIKPVPVQLILRTLREVLDETE